MCRARSRAAAGRPCGPRRPEAAALASLQALRRGLDPISLDWFYSMQHLTKHTQNCLRHCNLTLIILLNLTSGGGPLGPAKALGGPGVGEPLGRGPATAWGRGRGQGEILLLLSSSSLLLLVLLLLS